MRLNCLNGQEYAGHLMADAKVERASALKSTVAMVKSADRPSSCQNVLQVSDEVACGGCHLRTCK